MRIMLVAGARPNFMKVAPVLRAGRAAGHECLLVHTGQHYDPQMSDTFFADLEIPEPDWHLEVGSGSHAAQTARIMERFEPVLLEARPDWLLVVGDVNSTIACALVAAKLKHELGLRIAHLEAGLRSGDWTMPEEVNRVLTDRLSDLLLTPSHDAEPNLLREGIEQDRIRFVGNVMIDSLLFARERADTDVLNRLGVSPKGYALATLHRPATVDSPDMLRVALGALAAVGESMDVVFPVHPRTRARIAQLSLSAPASVKLVDPASYFDMVGLMANARIAITDSGGVQEETTALGVPCVTLRQSTERPVTVTEGTNRLAPWPLTVPGILSAIDGALAAPVTGRIPEGWDGAAAVRVIEMLDACLHPVPNAL